MLIFFMLQMSLNFCVESSKDLKNNEEFPYGSYVLHSFYKRDDKDENNIYNIFFLLCHISRKNFKKFYFQSGAGYIPRIKITEESQKKITIQFTCNAWTGIGNQYKDIEEIITLEEGGYLKIGEKDKKIKEEEKKEKYYFFLEQLDESNKYSFNKGLVEKIKGELEKENLITASMEPESEEYYYKAFQFLAQRNNEQFIDFSTNFR